LGRRVLAKLGHSSAVSATWISPSAVVSLLIEGERSRNGDWPQSCPLGGGRYNDLSEDELLGDAAFRVQHGVLKGIEEQDFQFDERFSRMVLTQFTLVTSPHRYK